MGPIVSAVAVRPGHLIAGGEGREFIRPFDGDLAEVVARGSDPVTEQHVPVGIEVRQLRGIENVLEGLAGGGAGNRVAVPHQKMDRSGRAQKQPGPVLGCDIGAGERGIEGDLSRGIEHRRVEIIVNGIGVRGRLSRARDDREGRLCHCRERQKHDDSQQGESAHW
jgi:hypothetical protein